MMIGFVLLHFQVEEETIKCIDSIKRNVSTQYRIVIVDNKSPNGSGEKLLRKYYSDRDVEVILSDCNLGFARGNNLGYKELRKDCDYIVVMNNDVELTQQDFCELVEKNHEKYHFDILGPDIYSTRGEFHQNPQREHNYTLKELNKRKIKLEIKNILWPLVEFKWIVGIGTKTNYKEMENDWRSVQTNKPLHGSCYIFSKRFIENHEECFYSKTFMYHESYILHYLAMKEDLLMVYAPEIKVLHHEDVSTNYTYNRNYKKARFENRHQLESVKVYIDLVKKFGELDC